MQMRWVICWMNPTNQQRRVELHRHSITTSFMTWTDWNDRKSLRWTRAVGEFQHRFGGFMDAVEDGWNRRSTSASSGQRRRDTPKRSVKNPKRSNKWWKVVPERTPRIRRETNTRLYLTQQQDSKYKHKRRDPKFEPVATVRPGQRIPFDPLKDPPSTPEP